MKKAQTVLDFNKDNVTMFSQEQPLFRTSSGHYAVPICPARLKIDTSECKIRKDYRYSLTFVRQVHAKIMREEGIEKLHRQFCHCSADELKHLIKSSAIWKKHSSIIDLVDKVSQKSQI